MAGARPAAAPGPLRPDAPVAGRPQADDTGLDRKVARRQVLRGPGARKPLPEAGDVAPPGLPPPRPRQDVAVRGRAAVVRQLSGRPVR